MGFYEQLENELNELKDRDQFRAFRDLRTRGGITEFNGRQMVNLSSNDYLGMAANSKLRDEFYNSLDTDPEKFALSASSSRLLTGNHPGYTELEAAISRMYNNRAALVFNSGYHANIGILPALAGSRDLILSDKLNHASIIDGIRLSGASFKRYKHLDFAHLETLLQKRGDWRNVFIVTESVFSMDGDVADLRKLAELKQRHNAVLIVDEAHGVGARGMTGCGVCEEQTLINDIDIIIGAFGKALGSAGAFAVTAPLVRDYLINNMRPLIFTTALPPIVVNWSRFVLAQAVNMTAARRHLQALSDKLRAGLTAKGWRVTGESQIVPLIVGDNAAAIKLAERLRNNELLVFAIRPPTVPPGSARLRFSLNAALSDADVNKILELL